MQFKNRHIDYKSVERIEKEMNINSHELIEKTIPENILIPEDDLDSLGEGTTEEDFLESLQTTIDKNEVFKSFIGQGYYGTFLPNVIKRNVLENPSWYTAYTPYQAEISQGRLESLINFQTMITSLTGMEISNASLLDESTSAAEAMVMIYNSQKGKNIKQKFYIGDIFKQTVDVLKSRAEGFNIELVDELTDDCFGCILAYQSSNGELLKEDIPNIPTVITTDLLALTLMEAPGKLSNNVHVVVGSTQRFGLPMGFGGPHSAFFATTDKYKRVIPGRIIGKSLDSKSKTAYRMALQTREQHIRREKATSNICTSQVLLANISSFYAIYHGPNGLKNIAERIHSCAKDVDMYCVNKDIKQLNKTYFDTLYFECSNTKKIEILAEKNRMNFRILSDSLFSISFDETTTNEDVEQIKSFISLTCNSHVSFDTSYFKMDKIPEHLVRKSNFLEHGVFNSYHTEHELLRYMKRLEKKDISLTDSMISLGSCTMKLNPTTAMIPLSWGKISNIHPFAPYEQTKGYRNGLLLELSGQLKTITGFDKISYQPNSGAQGEYTGLKVIKAFHNDIGQSQRNVVLIPTSAHGTNPASAKICGLDIILVNCNETGNIDIEDLKQKAEENKNVLSSLMITYPSTHGVFESHVKEICEIINCYGGKVYMDGANLNAQVGYTNPATIGADVCHMNLHKTFCIPHGGGGPGMGVIGVTEELADFLPQHYTRTTDKGVHAVSAAPFSSASILTISYAYITMMGKYLRDSTRVAILNANYMKMRLEKAGYRILYKGENDTIAHEMIVDFREFKDKVTVEDVSKRLIDYNYHAPTVSFPVPGTLMIEPTESETKEELDRFCDALINIKKEIEDSPEILKNAPHTIEDLTNWNYAYDIKTACYPISYVKERKYWSPVNRIDNSYGDRNLFCTCG